MSGFLQQLISAQRAYRNLATYMGDFEFSRIVSKLPSFLQTRWIRASYLSAQKKIRVGLQEFVDFTIMESGILYNVILHDTLLLINFIGCMCTSLTALLRAILITYVRLPNLVMCTGQKVNPAYSNVSETSASPSNSNVQLEEEEGEH